MFIKGEYIESEQECRLGSSFLHQTVNGCSMIICLLSSRGIRRVISQSKSQAYADTHTTTIVVQLFSSGSWSPCDYQRITSTTFHFQVQSCTRLFNSLFLYLIFIAKTRAPIHILIKIIYINISLSISNSLALHSLRMHHTGQTSFPFPHKEKPHVRMAFVHESITPV